MSTFIDLAGIGTVKHAMFIKLTIPDPNDIPPAGEPRADLVYRISNFEYPIATSIIEGSGSGSYDALGVLLNVSQFQNELRPSNSDVSIGLSAIPESTIAEALQYPIKGAPVEIRRAFFDPDTNQILNIGGNNQVALRYKGIVNNYSFNEEWSEFTQSVTFTATLSCTSIISVLQNKFTGRMTNSESWKRWSTLPTSQGGFNQANADISMDRVSTIAVTNWDFGGKVKPGAGSQMPGGGGGPGRGNFEDFNLNLP